MVIAFDTSGEVTFEADSNLSQGTIQHIDWLILVFGLIYVRLENNFSEEKFIYGEGPIYRNIVTSKISTS